jgi:hypothetical protein
VISGQSAKDLGGFEQRLLDELMQMIAEPRSAAALRSAQYEPIPQVSAQHGPRWQGPAQHRLEARRAATATRRRPGRVRVALTASVAAAAVTAVAVIVGLAGHDAAGKRERPSDKTVAGLGFPAANQAFYQVVNVGGQLSSRPGRHSTCQIIWYYTPLTGRYFQSFAEPCSANPSQKFPGPAVGMTGSGHGFPALPSLSDRPVALFGQLSRAADRGAQYWGADVAVTGTDALSGLRLTTHGAVMFTLVERLLEMPVPPGLRDAAYQVAGRIPGVISGLRKVQDITGQRAVVFELTGSASQSTVDIVWFVLSPGSHEFLGLGYVQRTRDGHWYTMSVLHTGLKREN